MPERFELNPEPALRGVETSPDQEFWQGTAISEKIARQRERGYAQIRALITDRDGTHSMWGYGFRGRPEELAEYDEATAKLNAYIKERDILLIMNTGGSIEMMESALADGSVPADAAISASGSEFHIVKDGHYVLWPEYQTYIENVVGFKRENVYPVCADFLARVESDVSDPAAPVADVGLVFQPRDSQENVLNWSLYNNSPSESSEPPEFEAPQKNKISFYCTGGPDAAAWATRELQRALTDRGMGHFKVVLTADSYEEGRFLIDVIPLGKQEAADIVINLLSKQFGPVLAAVAGDAQNDAEVILNSGTAAIAVGNRVPDLEQIIQDQPTTRETRNFKIVENEQGVKRLIYKGDSSQTVGASLLRGIRALERADRLIKNR